MRLFRSPCAVAHSEQATVFDGGKILAPLQFDGIQADCSISLVVLMHGHDGMPDWSGSRAAILFGHHAKIEVTQQKTS